MIRSNKKLYYKYFDLMRVSIFLHDEERSLRAKNNLSIIEGNFDTEIISLPLSSLLDLGFDNNSILEIYEFRETGAIQGIIDYVNSVESWIRTIILPDFFDLHMLSTIFAKEKIGSKEQLMAFFKSKSSEMRYGKEESELFTYFVQNIDGSCFPCGYRKNYSVDDVIIRNYSGEMIWGNFHNHTPYSDGKCVISELKNMAKACGRTYIGISDHTKKVRGVDEEGIVKQHHEIDELNRNDSSFIVLKSLECEILSDGKLDISDGYLKKCDYIIAAVHRDTCMTKPNATRRMLKAIDNTYTNILAHPSSRLYKRNIGLFLDMYKIIDACVANNVALEINGDPDRLDLDPKYIEYALKKGAYFTVDSDTHSFDGFKNINNAVSIAKDNNIPPDRILNTYKMNEMNFGSPKLWGHKDY